VLRSLGPAIRKTLEARGYWFRQRVSLPYGIDYLLDVGRLSAAWDRPVRIFFDVGANEGQTSRAARLAFPDAKLYAFEPYPATFQKLQDLATSDGRVIPHNLALSDRDGTVPLLVYGSLLNSLHANSPYNARFDTSLKDTVCVKCTTLDGFCEENDISAIDVLKIDTEGHEVAVLEGAKRMLSGGAVRFVYAEFNDFAQRPGTTGGALGPLGALLSGFGFRFVTTYIDHVVTDGDFFVTANVLFARPPSAFTTAQ